jgi:hypothetical protein
MLSKQLEKYLEAYKGVKNDMKDYDQLAKKIALHKFWQGARKYSNMLYNYDSGMQLSEFSNKLPVLIETIKKFPNQKQYIYSAFYENRGSSQGVLEIARQLESIGYTKLTLEEAKKYANDPTKLGSKKRYILAMNSVLGEGNVAALNMEFFMKCYNHVANKNADLVGIFLATQTFNEGLDMKAVRHIHIFEPLVTMASDLQTIGRARRNCSHADLDHDEWSVDIHRYFSEIPVEFNDTSAIESKIASVKNEIENTEKKREKAKLVKELKALNELKGSEIKAIDEFIYTQSKEKMLEIFLVYVAMEASAIDCSALSNFHSKARSSDYKDFKCTI